MFHERLREIRLSKNITAKYMSEYLGMVYHNYQRYETGEVDPPLSKVITLADYFDVSIDFLTGRCDNPNSHKL